MHLLVLYTHVKKLARELLSCEIFKEGNFGLRSGIFHFYVEFASKKNRMAVDGILRPSAFKSRQKTASGGAPIDPSMNHRLSPAFRGFNIFRAQISQELDSACLNLLA